VAAESRRQSEAVRDAVLATLQKEIGGCREWLPEKANNCWAPAEYVLWGKLIPAEGLGPRCYDHAAKHVGHGPLEPRSGYALINLVELAREVGRS
jgi:hypothetical protein